MLWRQGDIYIARVPLIPTEAALRSDLTLVEGELTGHVHQVEEFGTAAVYEFRGDLFLDVFAPRARIVHDEHGPVELEQGFYRVWRQREYDPTANVREIRIGSRLVMD